MLYTCVTQKAVFTREMIIEAAYQLTRERGWASVTARAVAQKLGSSTMPLYSSLKSMDDVEHEVRMRAQALMQDYQRRPYSQETLLNAAVGYVVFARDESNLFRFLYVDLPVNRSSNPEAPRGEGRDPVALGGVVDLADQTATAMKDPRVLKSWIFTHGLASLISGGVLELPTERIANLLIEAGAAFYAGGTGP